MSKLSAEKKKRPFWLQLLKHDYARHRADFNVLIPIFIGIYCIIIIIVTSISFLLQYIRQNSLTDIESLEKTDILQYVNCVVVFGFAEWLVAILSIGLILIWIWGSSLLYILLSLIFELIWQKMYPIDKNYFSIYQRFNQFVLLKTKHSFHKYSLCFLLVLFYFLFQLRDYLYIYPNEGVFIFGSAIIAIVIFVFSFYWIWFFRVLRRHPTAYHFESFLFSQHTARRNLKGGFEILVFLGLLTSVLLPLNFYFSKKTVENIAIPFCEIQNNQEEWTLISKKVKYSTDNEYLILPSPGDLAKKLDLLGRVRDVIPFTRDFKTTQKYLFFSALLFMLLRLGIPAVINIIRERGYRVAFTRLFVATAKTTVLLGVIQMFVLKTYLIDLSEFLGLGAIFSFIISIYILQDEKFYKPWQRNPIKSPPSKDA